MKLLNTDGIMSAGQLKELLDKIPEETALTPFGSAEAVLAYDEKNGCAYLDEISFLKENFDLEGLDLEGGIEPEKEL
jgi:hypothetical protein